MTPFLLLTSLVCGTLIMVIEVLGSRVIGPFFGVSLFVWTSLIAVAMIALAIGYAFGGWLADRRESPDTLYGLIIAAGVITLMIPLAKGPVLKACMTLGLRGGAFASSLILFGPPLLLLGCVSPFLIRIAAREVRNIGRTVGFFYAISTVGSVIGTVVTGFFLIAWMSVDQIFLAVGTLLILLGIVYFLTWRKRFATLALLLLLPVAWPAQAHIDKIMPNGVRLQLLEQVNGYYGSKKIVDYSYRDIHTREMLIDGLIQGSIDVNTGESTSSYPYVLGYVPRLINPGGARCLVIGLGAGIIPGYYEKAGITTDVVDIDPDIEALARNHFNFRLSGDIAIEDARYFLKKTDARYDYLILDVFSGDITPSHLLSLEAFQLMRDRLAPQGVLAINLAGSLKRENFMTASVIKTLREVFPQVDLYPNFDPSEKEPFGNISVFAYAGAPRQLPADYFSQLPVHRFARKKLINLPAWRYEFPPGTRAMILTDEFNPLDCNDLWLKEEVRRSIVAGTDWDLLLR